MNHPARFIREKIVSLIAIMNRMIKFREEKSGNETFSYDVSVRFSDGNRVHLGGEIEIFFFFYAVPSGILNYIRRFFFHGRINFNYQCGPV